MAPLNLYKVTKTLIDLLTQNIKNITQSVNPALNEPVSVTAIPPEKVENPSNTLSLYLYHVAEDPYYKNMPGPGSDVPNVARAPMALSLFYILTAHHEVDPAFDAETQQKLMGYALKTFHDFPVITDQTRIDGTFILDDELRGTDNTLQIILRPVSPEEAIAFWSSQETRTTRLSAYYEVRVVLLEPEKTQTMPGIVLNLGTFLVQMGAPHLDRSQSLVRFKIPAKNGGMVQQVEATPARVTLDSSASPPTAHNRLLLLGTNLAAGKSRWLFLKNSIWAKLLPPGGPIEQTMVDLSQNPDWGVEFQTGRVTVTLAPTLRHVKPDATNVALPVLPGFYSAFVRTVMDEKVISNELKQMSVSSNEVGFTVAPRITGHDTPDASGTLRIALGAEFDPLDTNLEDTVQVIVDGEVYTRVNADPPANPREFFVTNSPSNAIRLKPPFALTVAQPEAHPLRLIVNGAESAPFWLELNP